jgi:hypothetical protein
VAETSKERSDRQLVELLNELRVAWPGAQVLLAFLLAVPFATRFGRVDGGGKIALCVALISTVGGTLMLLAPSVYHRLRWHRGGKADVVAVGNVLFLVGTALLGVGIVAVVYLVTSVLYGTAAAIATTCVVALLLVCLWYLLPLRRGSRPEIRDLE